jgi:transcriptional regulator with XRE-family HTH domain
MIRNERQFRTSSRRRAALVDALDDLVQERQAAAADPSGAPSDSGQLQLRFELAEASLIGQINDVDAELREYEALRAGEVRVLAVASLADLPDALVRARIASGLTQRDLASRLDLKEQQIQRYEAEGYANASLTRLQAVMEALDVTLDAGLELPSKETPLSRLRTRLLSFGLDRRVVDRRLLRDAPENPAPAKVLELAERAARLLGTSVRQLLEGNEPLPALATTARFKAARSAAQQPLDAYTRYAESVADIVLRATAGMGPSHPPGSDTEVRAAIEQRAQLVAPGAPDPLLRSDVLFTAALQYLYELRIPVVPLRDAGAFHGACFSRDGRSVVVLKQTTDSAARWLFDLLHELHHTADPDRDGLRSWVELGAIGEWSQAPDEQYANDFAADVLFSGRAAPVLEQCLQMAEGSVERLRSVVPRVAAQAEVPVDVLATYLAFQLSRRGINWWPTAATLQDRSTPWRQATDLLLRQLDLVTLDAVDRAVLIDVLAG